MNRALSRLTRSAQALALAATLLTLVVALPGQRKLGRELGISDGTAAGTGLLKDIYPGFRSSRPERFVRLGGELVFANANLAEIWKTDCTAGGTRKVIDGDPYSMVPFRGAIYFGFRGGLWRTDGTVGGTTLVRTIDPGRLKPPFHLTVAGATLFFYADDGTHGIELWRSDGTTAGTRMTRDIRPGSASCIVYGGRIEALRNIVLFRATDGRHGIELWRSDGTLAGTSMVKDIEPGPDWSNPWRFEVMGDHLYFASRVAAYGVELWRSDGTAAGTSMVKDIAPGKGWSLPGGLTAIGDRLYFSAQLPATGRELWCSDGTAAGTRLVADIAPGTRSSMPNAHVKHDITALGPTVLFPADDGTHGRELWTTDGSAAGTRMVLDAHPGRGNGVPSAYGDAPIFQRLGALLYYCAYQPRFGWELWCTDGTAVGTQLVRDILPGTRSSAPTDFAVLGGCLVYAATFEDGVSVNSAAQVPDASRVVNVVYALEADPTRSYEVTLEISSNGGSTFRPVRAVSGAVGPGQEVGAGKRITWDPAVDLPGVSGRRFVARVAAKGVGQDDSAPFEVRPPLTTGHLRGTVVDPGGVAIAGAQVYVPGKALVTTGKDGKFVFRDLEAKRWVVGASHKDFEPGSASVEVRGYSGGRATISLDPKNDPGPGQVVIVRVDGEFTGPRKETLYLARVPLVETFTARVAWGTEQPDRIEWRRDGIVLFTDACTGDTCSRSMNMSLFGIGQKLSAVAVSKNGVRSRPYTMSFDVIPAPNGVVFNTLYGAPIGNVLYVSPSVSGNNSVAFKGELAAGRIPDKIPVFGKAPLKLGSAMKLAASFKGDGTGAAQLASWSTDVDVAGTKLEVGLDAGATWTYAGKKWHTGGSVKLTGKACIAIPPKPIPFVIPAPVGPIPAYFKSKVEPALSGELTIPGWIGPGDPLLNGKIGLDVGGSLSLGVGVADIVAMEVYGGLKLGAILTLPKGSLDVGLGVTGGVRLVLAFFVWEFPAFQYEWSTAASPLARPPAIGRPRFGLMPRRYLHPRAQYAIFHGGAGVHEVGSSTTEAVLQANVAGFSTPALAARGTTLACAWIHDDPDRFDTNRSQLVFSTYDSGRMAWSPPVPVQDDGTADLRPSAAVHAGGDLLLAWENVSEEFPSLAEIDRSTDVDAAAALYQRVKAATEIEVGRRDARTGRWTTWRLSANGHLDRSPRLAAAATGTALLTWVANPSDHEVGDATRPNQVMFSLFNGASWSRAGVAATGVPSIVQSTMAWDGAQGLFLYAADTTGSGDPVDRELFAIRYSSGGWGKPQQLTNDRLEDSKPRVLFVAPGRPVIVWYRAGELCTATRLDLADRACAVRVGRSSGAMDFQLAPGAGGRISLVWQDDTGHMSDLWTAHYDPASGLWSAPQRLTEDDSVEYGAAAAFDSSGKLTVIYDKASTGYSLRTMRIGGKDTQVRVPEKGQTDLYTLRRRIGVDVAIRAGALTAAPANPLPSTETTLHARVHNLGDVPVPSLEVEFFDGQRGGGGTLIRRVVLAGPIPGGGSTRAATRWKVPASRSTGDVWVYLDPRKKLADLDRTNNELALARVIRPDATVDRILVSRAGANARDLTIRLANAGSVDLSPATVTLRRGGPKGSVLAVLAVPSPVKPGAFYELGWRLTKGAAADERIFAVADETDVVEEHDESNNVASARVLWR